MKVIRLKTPKRLIGASDIIDLPDLYLYDIPCKIDTGAYTSAIHCHRIRVVQGQDGHEVLKFRLLDPSHEAYLSKDFTAKVFTERLVRSSFGDSEYRYVITTQIILFGKSYEAEFTLADRMEMRYPILLGRKLLRKRFLVDVSKRNLSYKNKMKPDISPAEELI